MFVDPNINTKVKILALGGGGNKGAYQAGAINALIHEIGDSTLTSYDYVTGISVGALNALPFLFTPLGEESKVADYLKKLWTKDICTSSNIYQE